MTEAISVTGPTPSPQVRRDLLEQLDGAIRVGADPADPEVIWSELSGPAVEPHQLLGLLQSEHGGLTEDVVAWECASERWLGWGAAVEVSADEPGTTADRSPVDRFEAVRLAAAAIKVMSCGSETSPPRWFGGFAFDADSRENLLPSESDVAAWHAFGSGAFVLPQIAVRRLGTDVAWFVALRTAELAAPRQNQTLLRLSWLWDQVEAGLPSDRKTQPELAVAAPLRDEEDAEPSAALPDADFAGRIQEVVDLIAAGSVQKIVAADQSIVPLAQSPRLDQVLALWAERAPESTGFLFARSGTAFLGATPERLVAVSGSRVTSQALAGTLPKQGTTENAAVDRVRIGGTRSVAAGRRLLDNPKEQHEHGFVVRHIVERLKDVCSDIAVEDEARVLELRDLLHLQTPIAARLKHPLHVLQLVGRLHPTPAVCGLPVDIAKDWIKTREVAARGWYSGPVGWFEPSGDGDFFVALRSMLLGAKTDHNGVQPNEATAPMDAWTEARLFAGVGLVAGSVVAEEQREVATKLLTAGRTLEPWRAARR